MSTESDQFYYRQLIYKNFTEILESRIISLNVINKHKKFINQFDLKGKAKYKTFKLLMSYYNSKDKDTALTSIRNFGYKKCFI